MNSSRVKLKYIRTYINKTLGRNIARFDIFWRELADFEREEIKANYLLCQKEDMADQFANSVLNKMEEVVDRPKIDTTPIEQPIKPFIPKTILRQSKK